MFDTEALYPTAPSDDRPNKRNSCDSTGEPTTTTTTHKRRGTQTKDKRPFLVSFLQSDHAVYALTNLLKFCQAHEGSWDATLAHGNRVSFFKEYTEILFNQESPFALSQYRKVSDRTLRKKFGEAEDFARTNYFRIIEEGTEASTNIPEWGLLFCDFFRSQKKDKASKKESKEIEKNPERTSPQENNDDVATAANDDGDFDVLEESHPITAVESLSESVREFVRMYITT